MDTVRQCLMCTMARMVMWGLGTGDQSYHDREFIAEAEMTCLESLRLLF